MGNVGQYAHEDYAPPGRGQSLLLKNSATAAGTFFRVFRYLFPLLSLFADTSRCMTTRIFYLYADPFFWILCTVSGICSRPCYDG